MIDDRLKKRFVPKIPHPSTKEEIFDLEAEIGRGFPASYIELVMLHDEGHLGPAVVPHDEEFHCDLHAVDVTGYPLVASSVRGMDPSCWPDGLVPIGSDGSGQQVVLDYSANADNPRVLLWTHGPSDTGQGKYLFLAKDFDEFLDRATPEKQEAYRLSYEEHWKARSDYIFMGYPDLRPDEDEEEWEEEMEELFTPFDPAAERLVWLEEYFSDKPLTSRAERKLRALRKQKAYEEEPRENKAK